MSTSNAKSQRKRLQRQLEFYLSPSNLRQDKFLQEHLDDDGLLPASLFLSFNRMKAMRATERLVLEAAEKAAGLRVDLPSKRLGPRELPTVGEDDAGVTNRTLYLEGFGPEHEHDSLRRVLTPFGKVLLVSMPRFQQSRKFKGFAFVEFATEEAATAALAAITRGDEKDLVGMKAMQKSAWQEIKDKLKAHLSRQSEATTGEEPTTVAPENGGSVAPKDPNDPSGDHRPPSPRSSSSGHIRFREDNSDEDEEPDAPQQKKSRVE